MKRVFENIMSCDDIQELKNCITIMAENCEVGMNNSTMLYMMKQIQGEISDGHYDNEMADMHLCLIGQLHTKDVAKDYWHEVKNDKINLDDWCVLWGEMVNRNDEKIRRWFPKINTIGYERKIFDECISFLNNGELPFYDLKV